MSIATDHGVEEVPCTVTPQDTEDDAEVSTSLTTAPPRPGELNSHVLVIVIGPPTTGWETLTEPLSTLFSNIVDAFMSYCRPSGVTVDIDPSDVTQTETVLSRDERHRLMAPATDKIAAQKKTRRCI